MQAYERFLKYITINTNSDEHSATHPSSPNQLVFGKQLVEELKGLGVSNAHIDDKGYVYASIPGKNWQGHKGIGFVAHMDTSPSVAGGPVNARIVKNYQGGDIVLNSQVAIKEEENHFLKNLIGQSLIVTDGTTLLGADNKAGVAEIMTLVQKLMDGALPSHPPVSITFTPDEEIGQGADFFDVKKFGAAYAYTVDGGALGEVEWENFNAASALVEIFGVNIHPGSAKNRMKNANIIALQFANSLPAHLRPEHTQGYEGFYHLGEMKGNEEKAELHYLIREHDKEVFENMKTRMLRIAQSLNEEYGQDTVKVTMKDSYYNMKEVVKDHMEIIHKAKAAMEAVGVTPMENPIRGGTDGARLSFMGLPCPNLSTGGYNFHSKQECISIEAMDKMVEVLLEIVRTA